jgi:hypothetical protein
MDHGVKNVSAKERFHLGAILKAHLMEFKVGELLQLSQAIPFQADVVVFVDAVEPNNALPCAQKAQGKVKTDETGAPGDQNGLLKTHATGSSPLGLAKERFVKSSGIG